MSKELANESDEKQPMIALARGIAVLRSFSIVDQELTSGQLAERTGLPKPTLFRITTSLRQLGLLYYAEERGTFMPTSALLAMSGPVLAHMHVRRLARPLMQQLANSVDGFVLISSASNYELVVVDTVYCPDSVMFRPEVGARLSLSQTAVGRAYLLSLPEEEQQVYFRRVEDADATRAEQLQVSLKTDAADIEKAGYCRAFGEVRRDVWGVAVPMGMEVDGQKIIFSCSVLPYSIDKERIEEIGNRLVSLVRNVESMLGSVDHMAPLNFEMPAQGLRNNRPEKTNTPS